MGKKLVTAKKTKTNRTKSKFTSHFGIAAKTNLLLFPTRYTHARYTSWMIDRFLNWGDHGKAKSGKIKGRCQPPLKQIIIPVKKTLNNAGHIGTKIESILAKLSKKSSEIGCFLLIVSWRSSPPPPPKFPVKSADFSKNFPLKILRNLNFFR